MLPAMLLTGTIGAGKTTIAEAISERLHAAGSRHALMDLDWLAQLYPAPEANDPYNTRLAARNLAAVWPNFSEAGARYAVLAATVESREQLQSIRSALPGVDLTVALVVADPEVVRHRILKRNRGPLQQDFLARTDALARTIEAAHLHSFVVNNSDDPPGDVATRVLEQLGWSSKVDRS